MGWILEILMINKQVSITFLLTRVGPKFLDEKEASISYFLEKEGGSQKYGWKTRKYRVLRVGGCLKKSKLQESSMMSVPFGQTPPDSTTKSLSVTFQMLWALATTNCGSIPL